MSIPESNSIAAVSYGASFLPENPCNPIVAKISAIWDRVMALLSEIRGWFSPQLRLSPDRVEVMPKPPTRRPSSPPPLPSPEPPPLPPTPMFVAEDLSYDCPLRRTKSAPDLTHATLLDSEESVGEDPQPPSRMARIAAVTSAVAATGLLAYGVWTAVNYGGDVAPAVSEYVLPVARTTCHVMSGALLARKASLAAAYGTLSATSWVRNWFIQDADPAEGSIAQKLEALKDRYRQRTFENLQRDLTWSAGLFAAGLGLEQVESGLNLYLQDKAIEETVLYKLDKNQCTEAWEQVELHKDRCVEAVTDAIKVIRHQKERNISSDSFWRPWKSIIDTSMEAARRFRVTELASRSWVQLWGSDHLGNAPSNLGKCLAGVKVIPEEPVEFSFQSLWDMRERFHQVLIEKSTAAVELAKALKTNPKAAVVNHVANRLNEELQSSVICRIYGWYQRFRGACGPCKPFPTL